MRRSIAPTKPETQRAVSEEVEITIGRQRFRETRVILVDQHGQEYIVDRGNYHPLETERPPILNPMHVTRDADGRAFAES